MLLVATLLVRSLASAQQPAKQTWITFSASGGEFSVELPIQPEHEILTLSSKHGTIVHDIYTATDAGFIFTIDRAELPREFVNDSATDKRLEEIQDALLKEVGATKTSEQRFELNEYSGREVRFDLPGGQGRMRLLLVGGTLYQVLVTRLEALSKSADPMKRFLESFKLLRRLRPTASTQIGIATDRTQVYEPTHPTGRD